MENTRDIPSIQIILMKHKLTDAMNKLSLQDVPVLQNVPMEHKLPDSFS